MSERLTILGIETSCDETAASVVRSRTDGAGDIASNIVFSQIEDHAPFGGVVPEIAARAHLDTIGPVIEQALSEADTSFSDCDAIAVTSGPGLAGGLIVGTMTARAIAAVHGKPLVAVNHLEGHALTARLTDSVSFPYLLLLVSGGHTQILRVAGVGDYERWATTIDDALGEAFDKTAKLLGLPYPGGPQVEKAARDGDPTAYDFPRPLRGRDALDMSFSGLKTAVRKATMEPGAHVADICASFQAAVADVLEDRVARAFERFEQEQGRVGVVVVAGGVAANTMLRTRLQAVADHGGWRWIAPPMALCTDNAAMIAWAGLERLRVGLVEPADDTIRPRWPLDPDAAGRHAKSYGGGRKGAKA
ncbi:MAG: tRNA (adenosine(37)-N6)-threonylcarbamoyltransferase complex transferase subunit TsaD [Pseudomonadota bacterium]